MSCYVSSQLTPSSVPKMGLACAFIGYLTGFNESVTANWQEGDLILSGYPITFQDSTGSVVVEELGNDGYIKVGNAMFQPNATYSYHYAYRVSKASGAPVPLTMKLTGSVVYPVFTVYKRIQADTYYSCSQGIQQSALTTLVELPPQEFNQGANFIDHRSASAGWTGNTELTYKFAGTSYSDKDFQLPYQLIIEYYADYFFKLYPYQILAGFCIQKGSGVKPCTSVSMNTTFGYMTKHR